MDYMHVAVLLVTLTQIIVVGAYVYLSYQLRRTHKSLRLTHEEMDAAYSLVTLLVQCAKEQELKIALLLKMHDIEIEGFEVATSPEEAISKIFESMGESADDLKPEDFN